MTKERLKSYQKLRADISILENELRAMDAGENTCSADVILSYTTGRGIPQQIYGFDEDMYRRKKSRKAHKEAECRKIAKWIDTIEDDRTRKVFELRYLEGLRWVNVASKIGMPHKEEYVRRHIHDFYLENIKI